MLTPHELGFDRNAYPLWRRFQAQTVEQILESDKELIIVSAPTGSGKSMIALACARVLAKEGKTTTILTHQTELQRQYLDYQFAEKPYVLTATGRRNHPCVLPTEKPGTTADEAPCVTANLDCELRKPTATGRLDTISCPFYRQRDEANANPIRVLNYPFWLLEANHLESSLFTTNHLLVCDEGHRVDKEILKVAAVDIGDRDLDILHGLGGGLGRPPSVIDGLLRHNPRLRNWVTQARNALGAHISDLVMKGTPVKAEYRHLFERIVRAASFTENHLVVAYSDRQGIHLTPVLPEQWAKEYLMRHSPKTVLMSATIFGPDYWAKRLGTDSVEYIEVPSTFPVGRRPVYYMPVVRMNYRTDIDSMLKVVDAIDWIIKRHLPQKGIIHAVSWKLANFIKNSSQFGQLMIMGGKETVEEFKNSKMGIYVSPSATEGYDFRDDLARYVIFPKVPWLPREDPVIKIQREEIPGFYDYEAMSAIIQGAGRAMRHEDDWAETFILDSSFGQLFARTKNMLPSWFRNALIWKPNLITTT
jgi:Rad3-related DNA helicase